MTKLSPFQFRFSIILLLFLFLCLNSQITGLQLPKSTIGTPKINGQPSPFQVVGVYALAPAVPTLTLPILAENFRSTQETSALLSVLVAKRVFIYLLAIIATIYAGWRASCFSLPAGESLDALNRELLKGEAPVLSNQEDMGRTKRDDGVFAALDDKENIGQNVAYALPFFLTGALILSYALLNGTTDAKSQESALSFKEMFNVLSTISNFAICLIFTAAEFRSLSSANLGEKKNNNTDDAVVLSPESTEMNTGSPLHLISVPNAIAFGTVLAAFSLPLYQAWPFQNSINIAIAVSVTRALAPFIIGPEKSMRTIALALIGLSFYDVISVFGTNLLGVQSAAAAVSNIYGESAVINYGTYASTGIMDASNSYPTIDISTGLIASTNGSVMESVARAKLQGPWRPGLLEMVLVGRVSDAIGLGDIVFPACLVSWGFALDTVYAYAAITGYILGSFLTEIVSTLGPSSLVGQGLPALLFITPAMLFCVSFVALQRDEFDEIWNDN